MSNQPERGSGSVAGLRVHRSGVRLRPDPGRVVARVFLPGQELIADRKSRAGPVIERILALREDQVDATLADTLGRFASRHRHFTDILDEHFELVAHRLDKGAILSAARRRLIGAYFTTEFALEAAAVFNPSIVPHPDQTGLPPSAVRFIMSVRAVGEGHLSSIEFRTGMVTADGTTVIDDPGEFLQCGTPRPCVYDRELFRTKLAEMGDDSESAALVLDSLPVYFTEAELEEALVALTERLPAASTGQPTIERLLWVAACNYVVDFPGETGIAERVLFPTGPAERRGIEDARFVRLVDDDGSAMYYATYTAFDGVSVTPQLLETADFRTFRSSVLVGAAAKDKGMALFPRRVNGLYMALSRFDRESTSVVASHSLTSWSGAEFVQRPEQPWELINIGNCGSPLETSRGWLVLTHGVGPVRTYSLGAILLDIDDPTEVVASLDSPIMVTTDEEREGYVPNVLYSCGALLTGDTLVLPYGIGDATVGVATMSVDELLDCMRPR